MGINEDAQANIRASFGDMEAELTMVELVRVMARIFTDIASAVAQGRDDWRRQHEPGSAGHGDMVDVPLDDDGEGCNAQRNSRLRRQGAWQARPRCGM